MTSFNIFDFNSFVNNNNNIFNVLRNQRNLQTHCDFKTSSVRFASNISISRFLLQSIFFNKHVIIDLVSFSLSSIKRIRLISFVRNIRDRKSSTFYVSATSSVDIRFIQSAIIRCESLKKKKNRFSKSTVTEKKKKNKFVKSNVAQNICESLKKRKDRFSKIETNLIQHKSNATEKKKKNKSIKSNVASFNKKESNSSIKKKTVNEMKNVKSIRFETMKKKKTRKKNDKTYRHAHNASKLCAKVTRRRIRCLRRFLLRRLLLSLLHVENAILVTNTKIFFNFFFLILMKNFDQRVYTASLMTSII